MAKRYLHVGCGPPRPSRAHQLFPDWEEVRLDIDRRVDPDIVSSMVDMPEVETGSFDAVFAQHSLEHLDPHKVQLALHEFRRVLRTDGGFALIIVPDLLVAAEFIVAGKVDEPCYESASGPVTPIDMIYGYSPAISAGQSFMAHRTGFTTQTMVNHIRASGFPFAGAISYRRKKEVWAEARTERGKPDILARVAASAKLTRE